MISSPLGTVTYVPHDLHLSILHDGTIVCLRTEQVSLNWNRGIMERTDHCIEELKSWKVLSTAIHWLSSVGPDASILSWISFICKKKVETKVYILSASFSFQLLHDPKSFSSSKFNVYSVLWLFCYFQATSSFQVLLTSFRIDGKNNWNVFIFHACSV